MAFNFVWSSVCWVLNMGEVGVLYERSLEIASVGGGLVFELGWMVDGLSIMMYWVVAAVGLAVFVYAHGYMKGEVRVTFFFACHLALRGVDAGAGGEPQPGAVDHRLGGAWVWPRTS